MNTKPYLEIAEYLVSQDETELAIRVLEMLPALYRDRIPKEILDFKSLIKRKIILPYDLLADSRELPKSNEWSVEFLNSTARGLSLKHLVKDLNDKDIIPHIVDMGPGDFTFAIGLKVEGKRFTYDCYTLNTQAKDRIKQVLGDMYKEGSSENTIFVAYEIIEHLSNTDEIRQCMDRLTMKPRYVLLSTPRYTFVDGTPNWKTDGIHHLRAYTPNEFVNASIRLFPEFKFNFIDDEVMVMIGERPKAP